MASQGNAKPAFGGVGEGVTGENIGGVAAMGEKVGGVGTMGEDIVGVGVTGGDLENPSPSQSLLQRLKGLREWQERQREELMQVLSHTNPSKQPNLSTLNEETTTTFSESFDNSTPPPPPSMAANIVEAPHITPEVEATSLVIPPPPPHIPEVEDEQARQRIVIDTPPNSYEFDPTRRESSPPIGYNTTHNGWEGDERDVRGEYDAPQEGIQDSLSSHDPNNFINDSMEDLLGLEKQKPYRSEKYKGNTISHDSQAQGSMKNPIPSKSFFTTITEGSERGGDGGVEETQRPRPTHRFLRKGQGTCRFGMRPIRLKGKSKIEAVNEEEESNCLAPPLTPSPQAKSQFRLPMQSLKLQKQPQMITNSVGGLARHRASPLLASTQDSTTPLPPPPPRDLEKQRRKEAEELSAFEKLEELAEDSSFSSTSSTVRHLLKQGQHSVSSTPLRTPPPLTSQETPVVGSLGMESRNLGQVRDLIHRVLPPPDDLTPRHPPHQGQAVDVKEVLAQLRAIVRLEGHSISDVTESDIQSFLEGCTSQNLFTAQHPTSTPAPLLQHPTSTPTLPQPPPPHQHHVHFASAGVQVMEYELSDTDGEDTLTDATSLDSDLITTSDMEALTQLSVQRGFSLPYRQQQQQQEQRAFNIPHRQEGDSTSSSEVTLMEEEEVQGQEPVVLTFSPPPPRPVQSASNYIWSIFGKERDAKRQSAPKGPPKQAIKETQKQDPPPKLQDIARRSVSSATQPHAGSQEVEVHKTLLLAKVEELEKETNMFKKENAKLQRLQEQIQDERRKLEEEKYRLQEESATDKRRFQEYVERERNAIWREKQQVLQKPPAVPHPQENTMEVVRLREQIRELQEEAERKESLNRFTIKKLSDRINTLENENRKLKEKNHSLQTLEKENQDLRLKVDQGKVGGRGGGRGRPLTHTSKPTRGRSKSSITTTVDGVAKALDKMIQPQPVIVKEVQRIPTQRNPAQGNPTQRNPSQGNPSQGNPSKTKQDLVNNNLNLASGSVEDAFTKTDSPHTPPPVTHTPPSPPSPPLPVWSSLGCSEEAGLEHTERVREDGIREVIYANGNRKEIHPSGKVTVSFYNGDRKETHSDRTVYVYGSDHTSHTTFATGEEELVFPNGQRETRHPDGSSEISFPNGSKKCVFSDGTEISTTKDGSVVRTNPDGSQVFEFPSGQREVHRDGEKRREYPNGTVKILHSDGRTETRYSSGRIRIKDMEGNVILDTHAALSLSS